MKKAKRIPTDYSATIHTLTVEPVFQGGNTRNVEKRPYINRIQRNSGTGNLEITLNPHKRHMTPDGKFVFEYWSLSRFTDELKEIQRELGAESLIIRRLDLAVDTTAPYNETAKVVRPILLALAEASRLTNRYVSTDPANGICKTLRADNGGQAFTLQVEHYNRALEDQSNWNRTVNNRLEFRSAREQAGANHSVSDIVSNWRERLEHVCNQLPAFFAGQNALLLDDWLQFGGKLGRETGSALNVFMLTHESHIYTREQAREFFACVTNTDGKKALQNFIDRKRWGGLIETYSAEEYTEELGAILNAIQVFESN